MAVDVEQIVWECHIGWNQVNSLKRYSDGKIGLITSYRTPVAVVNTPIAHLIHQHQDRVESILDQDRVESILGASDNPEEALAAIVALARMTT